jgi:hypothetical protein
MKALTPHQLEMLRVIVYRSPTEGEMANSYWVPGYKEDYWQDGDLHGSVFVYGSRSVGAIKTLTTRGLVAVVPGAADKYARRATAAGRAYLQTLREKA